VTADNDPDQNVERERRRNHRRDVVVAGLLDDRSRILMVRTSRLPGRWQPIGGGVEPGDRHDLRRAIMREIEEEIGVRLQPSDLDPVLDVPYDFGEGTVHFFRARLEDCDPPLSPAKEEIVEYRWLSIDDALRLPVFPATARFLQALARIST
jgi:8-oxo-dGTP pyrophosphatase MutT (NUDIX family)